MPTIRTQAIRADRHQTERLNGDEERPHRACNQNAAPERREPVIRARMAGKREIRTLQLEAVKPQPERRAIRTKRNQNETPNGGNQSAPGPDRQAETRSATNNQNANERCNQNAIRTLNGNSNQNASIRTKRTYNQNAATMQSERDALAIRTQQSEGRQPE